MKNMKIMVVLLAIIGISFSASNVSAQSLLEPVVSITGKITDCKDKIFDDMTIFVINEAGKTLGKVNCDSENGTFFLTGLKPGTNYTLKFSISKTEFEKMEIATPLTSRYLEIEQDFKLKKLTEIIQTAKK